MTKPALYKPTLYFERGYWRVRASPVPWSQLRALDKQRRVSVSNHAGRLNVAPFALKMRAAYAQRVAQEKRIARQKAFAMTSVPHPDGPVSLYDLLNGR